MPYTKSIPVQRYFLATIGSSVVSEGTRTFAGIRTGMKVDNWRDKVRAGDNAASPFTADMYRIDDWSTSSVSSTARSRSTGDTAVNVCSGLFSPVPQVPHLTQVTSAVENKALVKAIQKVKAVQSDLNGWTFLGELHQTIGMLKRPAAALRDNLESYLTTLEKRKRGISNPRSPGGRRALQSILSGTWLEAQFGWKPLISDTKAIATAIGRQLDQSPERKRVVAGASETQRLVTIGDPVYKGAGIKLYQKSELETKVFCTFTVGLRGDITGPSGSIERLKGSLGFTAENFIPTLWEVLPWSFLIDYFTNVGDIIEAASFSSNNVKWLVKSVGTVTSATETWNQVSAKTDLDAVGWDELNISGGPVGRSKVVRTTFERTIPQEFGVPTFELTTPSKLGQQLNILALLAQRGRRFAS